MFRMNENKNNISMRNKSTCNTEMPTPLLTRRTSLPELIQTQEEDKPLDKVKRQTEKKRSREWER